MTRAKYIASFIRYKPRTALFAGLYSNDGWASKTKKQCATNPFNVQLGRLGMWGEDGPDDRPSRLWFDLNLTDFFSDWKGKLIVGWPGLERSWWRWANRNDFPVQAILDECDLGTEMPSWDEIDLTWEELKVLPPRWKAALSQWRGIYYIFDT